MADNIVPFRQAANTPSPVIAKSYSNPIPAQRGWESFLNLWTIQSTSPPEMGAQLKAAERKMSEQTREEVDAKIAASEARSDTRIVRVEGKIDNLGVLLGGKMDALRNDVAKADTYNRETRWVLVVLVLTVGLALGALAVAMATYGDALFGRGMNVKDVIQATIKDTLEQAKKDAPKAP